MRFEPSASKPVRNMPNPGPANTRAPKAARPLLAAICWLRLVIITSTQALATPVPKRSSRCDQKPWAQYDAKVRPTHSHKPPCRRRRTCAARRANMPSIAPMK
ncbi:hypothetical protein D3C72_1813810 [compost metagenome]